MHEVGKSLSYPFVIAYLFTKNGVEKYCGSIDRIEEATKNDDNCHGICHGYKYGKVFHKYWQLFGKCRKRRLPRPRWGRYARLDKINSRSDEFTLQEHKLKFNGTRYVLFVDEKVMRIWRKLPSTYLRDLDKI